MDDLNISFKLGMMKLDLVFCCYNFLSFHLITIMPKRMSILFENYVCIFNCCKIVSLSNIHASMFTVYFSTMEKSH